MTFRSSSVRWLRSGIGGNEGRLEADMVKIRTLESSSSSSSSAPAAAVSLHPHPLHYLTDGCDSSGTATLKAVLVLECR